MKNPKISVIIPIFNTAAYLGACLDSIRHQTFSDFEVIMINDGSSDDSDTICQHYTQIDDRFILINQSNLGVTMARRNGVFKANGEYITFVDSDDTIPNNALELLITHASDNTDIILGKIDKFSYPEEELISISEYRRRCLTGEKVILGPYAKLFKRSLFSEHIFSIPRVITHGEDALMNIRLAFASKKDVISIGEIVYYYNVGRDGSATDRFTFTPAYAFLLHQHRFSSVPCEYIPLLKNELYHFSIKNWLYAIRTLPVIPNEYLSHHLNIANASQTSKFPLNIIDKCSLMLGNGVTRLLFVNCRLLIRKIINYTK